METAASQLQIASPSSWVSEVPRRSVIQAIEPGAENVLRDAGGQILSHHEGYVYEEYRSLDFPTIVLYWRVGTRFVYLRPSGQEDRMVIFLAALLPDSHHELHLSGLVSPLFPIRPVRGVFYPAGSKGAYLQRKGGTR